VITGVGILVLTLAYSQAVAAPIEETPPPGTAEPTPAPGPGAAPAPTLSPSPTPTQQDLFRSTLQKMIGKHVTVHLMAGRELTGLVNKVTDDAVHLSELGGRDFFDAIVRMEHISAIIFRVKKE
jgi:hypothetical protein